MFWRVLIFKDDDLSVGRRSREGLVECPAHILGDLLTRLYVSPLVSDKWRVQDDKTGMRQFPVSAISQQAYHRIPAFAGMTAFTGPNQKSTSPK